MEKCNITEDLIGKEFYYRSEITNCYTKFKVKQIEVEVEVVDRIIHFTINMISENNNKYVYQEDYILTEPLNK